MVEGGGETSACEGEPVKGWGVETSGGEIATAEDVGEGGTAAEAGVGRTEAEGGIEASKDGVGMDGDSVGAS